MQYVYPCVLTSEPGGGFSVHFPDVPEALTCGDDRNDALAMAEDALVVALGTYVRCGEKLPTPGTMTDGQSLIAVPAVVAAKLALYSIMRRDGLTKAVLARRLRSSEGEVRKLLSPEHPSRIGQLEDALRAVGRRLAIADGAAVVPIDYYSDEQVAEWDREDQLPEHDRQRVIEAITGRKALE